MGQVSSRISNILGKKNDQDIINGANNFHVGQNTEPQIDISGRCFDENKKKKYTNTFFSCVTPRVPLKRSRQISPEAEAVVPQQFQDIFSPEKRARMDDYLDYSFLNDYQSINFIKSSKIMFIMRGLPGSGKSTVCKSLKKKYTEAQICSADNFFMVDGEYKYDFKKIGEAHEQCHRDTIERVQSQCNVIIIDNTNVKLWEMKFYLQLAKEYNYIALVVEPNTPWRRDLQTLVKNTTHNVTKEIMERKLNAFEEELPLYYGWFLNEKDSYQLDMESRSWFKEAFEFADFKKDISFYTGCRNFEDFVNFFEKPRGEMMFHCTANFLESEDRRNFDKFHDNNYNNAIGKAFTIEVIGFVLTPRTIGARLKLTNKQKMLWAQDDHEEIPCEFKETQPISCDDYNFEDDNNSHSLITEEIECSSESLEEGISNISFTGFAPEEAHVEILVSTTTNKERVVANKENDELELVSLATNNELEDNKTDERVFLATSIGSDDLQSGQLFTNNINDELEQNSLAASNESDVLEHNPLFTDNTNDESEKFPFATSNGNDDIEYDQLSNNNGKDDLEQLHLDIDIGNEKLVEQKSLVASYRINDLEEVPLATTPTSNGFHELEILAPITTVDEQEQLSAPTGIEVKELDNNGIDDLENSLMEVENSNSVRHENSEEMSCFSQESEPIPFSGSLPIVAEKPEISKTDDVKTDKPIDLNQSPFRFFSPRQKQRKEMKSPQKNKVSIPKYTFNCKESKVTSSLSETYLDLSENRFQPTSGEGKRAHITLGCAPDIKPTTTGLDLLFVNQLEHQTSPVANFSSQNEDSPNLSENNSQLSNSQCFKTINLNGAVLKNYGHGVWVVYLENKLTASSLFAMKC